ncbi:MAG: hypothetical protein QXW94_05720 [Desulfurococcaceae archaeon]
MKRRGGLAVVAALTVLFMAIVVGVAVASRGYAKPAMEATLAKQVEGGDVTVRVTVVNSGGEKLYFPNPLYGLTVERMVDGVWVQHYAPVTAQVVVELEPGRSGEATVELRGLEPGLYRAVVWGWTGSQQLAKHLEFTFP